MIVTVKQAPKKECRKFGGPLLAQSVGGPRIVGWSFPTCSGDKCMDWRWSAEYPDRGYCGRAGQPESDVIEGTPEEDLCPASQTAN